MSPLAMALAAALVTGSAPANASGEMVQALDFNGAWYGVFADNLGHAKLENGCMDCYEMQLGCCWRCRDEGGCRFTVKAIMGIPWRGIYKLRGNCIIVCVRMDEKAYPTSFRAAKGQWLLTLRPITPRK